MYNKGTCGKPAVDRSRVLRRTTGRPTTRGPDPVQRRGVSGGHRCRSRDPEPSLVLEGLDVANIPVADSGDYIVNGTGLWFTTADMR